LCCVCVEFVLSFFLIINELSIMLTFFYHIGNKKKYI
jgi:hypothetical protein